MNKRLIKTAILVFLGVLLVSLPLARCDEKEKITITTEQLREGIAATVGVHTYSLNLKNWSKANFDADERKSVTTKLDETSIVMDKSNKKLYMIVTEETEFQDLIEGDNSFSTQKQEELHTIDNISYFENNSTDCLWRRSVFAGPAEDNEEWWKDWEHDSIREQFWCLEISEIEITDIETVNGVECRAIKLLPNSQLYSDLTGYDEQHIEGLSVKQWFAKDTYFLMKAKMEWKNVCDEELDIMVMR